MSTENDNAPIGQVATPKRRWVKGVLVVSLALNLLVLGVVGGAIYGRMGGVDRAHMRDHIVGPYMNALNPSDRANVGAAMRADFGSPKGNRRQQRLHFEALISALRAEPFDGAAVEALLTTQQARNVQRLQSGQRIIVERINAMSPDGRSAFAERLQKGIHRRFKVP